MAEESRTYKYFAFISYKSEDLKQAWRLKKKLDDYKLPTLLCKQYEKDRRPTREAFLDKTNIQPGDLTNELKDNLDNSHYLIVVCSPRSAKSKYVSSEIEWFTRNGREHELFLFIIESDPSDIMATFNPAIIETEKRWSERDGEKREILGVNIKEKDVDKLFFLYRWPVVGPWLQRERAYMQLISRLLGLEFEQLWSYQRIRLAETIIAWILGIILVLGSLFYTWYINQPVNITIHLNEVSVHNKHLPPLKDAVVTILLDNKTEVDTIHTMDGVCVFKDVAHKHLNRNARMTVSCQNWLDVDTTFVLTKNILLDMRRNPAIFGDVNVRLFNPDKEIPVADVDVEIAGISCTSDKDGRITLFVPLENQRNAYSVQASVTLVNDTLPMPCGPDKVLLVK